MLYIVQMYNRHLSRSCAKYGGQGWGEEKPNICPKVPAPLDLDITISIYKTLYILQYVFICVQYTY